MKNTSWFLLVLLFTLCLPACSKSSKGENVSSGSSSESENSSKNIGNGNKENVKWSQIWGFGDKEDKMLPPKPPAFYTSQPEIMNETGAKACVLLKSVSLAEIKVFVEQLKNDGFSMDVYESSSDDVFEFSAGNLNGYRISITVYLMQEQYTPEPRIFMIPPFNENNRIMGADQ